MLQTADTISGNIAAEPRFSWARVKAVAEFYYPLLRPQIILYPLMALALYVVAAASTYVRWTDIFWAIPATVISFMFYLAPAVLTRHDARMVEMLLPATALEKILVLGVYFLIAVPLMTYGIYYVVGSLIELVCPFATVIGRLSAMRHDMGVPTIIYQATEVIPAATCLWVVMAVKRNRMLKASIYTILSVFALGFIGMVCGVIMALKNGFIDGVKQLANDPSVQSGNLTPEQMNELTSPFVTDMLPLMTCLGVISVIYLVFALWMTYRTIKKRQI